MGYIKNPFSLLILSLFLISFISAQNSVRLQLCTNSNCYDYNDPHLKTINNNESIILKVGIIPKENKFICFNGLYYYFKISFANLQNYPNNGYKTISNGIYSNTYGSNLNPYCFSNHEYDFYIPFNDYNSMDPHNRIGTWTISNFELTFSNRKNYDDVSLSHNPVGVIENTLVGNEIQFTVATKVPSINWFSNVVGIWRGLLIGLNAIFVLVGGILLTIGLTKHKKRNYILFGVISLIMALILFVLGFYS